MTIVCGACALFWICVFAWVFLNCSELTPQDHRTPEADWLPSGWIQLFSTAVWCWALAFKPSANLPAVSDIFDTHRFGVFVLVGKMRDVTCYSSSTSERESGFSMELPVKAWATGEKMRTQDWLCSECMFKYNKFNKIKRTKQQLWSVADDSFNTPSWRDGRQFTPDALIKTQCYTSLTSTWCFYMMREIISSTVTECFHTEPMTVSSTQIHTARLSYITHPGNQSCQPMRTGGRAKYTWHPVGSCQNLIKDANCVNLFAH